MRQFVRLVSNRGGLGEDGIKPSAFAYRTDETELSLFLYDEYFAKHVDLIRQSRQTPNLDLPGMIVFPESLLADVEGDSPIHRADDQLSKDLSDRHIEFRFADPVTGPVELALQVTEWMKSTQTGTLRPHEGADGKCRGLLWEKGKLTRTSFTRQPPGGAK